MLLRITSCTDLDSRKLMDIYSENNTENAEDFYPGETDRDVALRKVETGFMSFLEQEFFTWTKAACWIWEEDGLWVSALRNCEIQDGLHYLEALETHPAHRNKGYGSLLLSRVLSAMREDGPFRLCDCVSKRNAASLKIHEKCGFRIVSESGYNYLYKETDEHDFGLEYSCS